jgi:hypothetical protein
MALALRHHLEQIIEHGPSVQSVEIDLLSVFVIWLPNSRIPEAPQWSVGANTKVSAWWKSTGIAAHALVLLCNLGWQELSLGGPC